MARPVQAADSHRPLSHSPQSRFGLNATNFFLAEMGGVVVPFLAKFLADRAASARGGPR
jgi:hypothetical protein